MSRYTPGEYLARLVPRLTFNRGVRGQIEGEQGSLKVMVGPKYQTKQGDMKEIGGMFRGFEESRHRSVSDKNGIAHFV